MLCFAVGSGDLTEWLSLLLDLAIRTPAIGLRLSSRRHLKQSACCDCIAEVCCLGFLTVSLVFRGNDGGSKVADVTTVEVNSDDNELSISSAQRGKRNRKKRRTHRG
jgi:hypothetical protein